MIAEYRELGALVQYPAFLCTYSQTRSSDNRFEVTRAKTQACVRLYAHVVRNIGFVWEQAAESKLAEFLALMPAEQMEAARSQVVAFN
eukprot:131396-Pyramimonas_sp.AAC.2